MAGSGNHVQSRDARLKRLAERIDALVEKDAISMRRAKEIAELRRAAAGELHSICADLVQSLNSMVAHCDVELDPPIFNPDAFHEDAPNVIQINVRGRLLQLEFETTHDLVSSEEFRIPYTIEGSVRAFNQDLLDKSRIEEQLIFYTVEKHRTMWRFFDGRTYRSGPLDEEYLISLIEHLI